MSNNPFIGFVIWKQHFQGPSGAIFSEINVSRYGGMESMIDDQPLVRDLFDLLREDRIP